MPGVTHGDTGLRCGQVPALGGLRQQATPRDAPAAHALGGVRAAPVGPCARAAVALQQRRPQQPLILLQGEHAHKAVQSGIITAFLFLCASSTSAKGLTAPQMRALGLTLSRMIRCSF